MESIYADFSIDPARLGQVAVHRERCTTTASHLMLDAGGWVELHFEAAGPQETAQATVVVTALVSKRGPLPGYAPIDVLINGIPLINDHVIPGGDIATDTALAVPGEHLVAGTNVLKLRTTTTSITRLWLYRITLDTLENRGGAVKALRREAAKADSALAYRIERCPAGTDTWQPAPRLLVHLDRGEYADLTQLSWRDEDGAEATVSFHSAMVSFYGHHRTKDGVVSEIRGNRVESSASPAQVSPAAVHVFKTQEGWGGGWHDSGELRLLLDDGGADVERVSWRDSAANSGSVELELPTPNPDDSKAGKAASAWVHAEVSHNAPGEMTGLVSRVAASGENPGGGEVARSLIDGTPYSKWLTFSGTARLDFTLERPAAIGAYELTSANDFATRDPRDWTLSGSPDGRTWTVLDTRSDELFSARHLSRVFRIRRADQAAYRIYRLEISRNAGRAQQIQLARVRFFRPAIAPALGFTGYYQRAGEGPIGYRGRSVAAATPLANMLAAPLRPMTTASRLAGPLRTAAVPARPALPAVPARPAVPGVPARRSVAAVKARSTPMKPRIPAVPAVGKAAGAAVPAAQEAESDAGPSLATVEGWQRYLTEFGTDVVRVMNERERREFTPEQLARGWLGGDRVDEARIVALEERLGTRLPATYRAFVGASDGWRNISEFMYSMRTVDEIGWFREAEPETFEILGGDDELGPLLERALLISQDGDAQYWFLDTGDVSPDGEWAAYTWSSWGFLSERFPSFAALVADERQDMEKLRGYHGAPMHPEGAGELLAEGRAQALRGEVEEALRTFDRAAIKGSGAATYLKVVLGLFMKSEHGQHVLRNEVFGRPNVMAEIGLEQLRAEAIPLFLHLTYKDPVGNVPAYLPMLEDLLPPLPDELADGSQAAETGDADEQAAKRLFDPNRGRGRQSIPDFIALRERMIPRAAGFVPPVLAEPPAFDRALAEARALVQAGRPDEAWAVIEAALPGWRSESPTRVAPVILLVDPVLKTLITPARSRQIVRTPRGAA